MRSLPVALWACLCLWAAATSAAAQPALGAISGQVRDASGAMVPNVQITVTGPGLLAPVRASTGDQGTYQIPGLPHGTYTITFFRDGFQTLSSPPLLLSNALHADVDVVLVVEGVVQTLTVDAVAPIDARAAGTRQTFTRERLERVPSSRDPWALLQQTPGVSLDRENIAGAWSGQQSNFTSRAAPPSQTVWSLDGLDITDMTFVGAAATYVDFDALDEVSIATTATDVRQQTGGVGPRS